MPGRDPVAIGSRLPYLNFRMTLLDRLFGTPAPATESVQPPAAVPDGQRVYAIGDVHGRRDLLDDLLGQIGKDDKARGKARTTLIFLGDLIDRGPNSRQVIERTTRLAASGEDVRFILGNHEEAFLAALDGREGAMRFFLRVGGIETLKSYGLAEDALFDTPEQVTELALAGIPPGHRAFIAGFEEKIMIGDYLFVHAGIRPGVPIVEQTGTDLRWIREPFLDHRGAHPHVIVHGHTISTEVDDRGNRIGIDTGAYHSGRLTALGLEGTDRWLLQTGP